MKTVDALGHKCPMPLILTKRALLEMQPGEPLDILVDNETSVKNVTRFLTEHGMTVETRYDGGHWRMSVNNSGKVTGESPAEEYCEVPAPDAPGYMVAFTKNIQGAGADELGYRLTQLFINTLPEIDRKPESLVFLNSSVFLCLNGSPVLEPLKKLEDSGVKILVCGTCLNFFEKADELAVGIISNMYEILDQMSKAPKVLYP